MIPRVGRALAASSPFALHPLQFASSQFLLRRSPLFAVAPVRARSSTSKSKPTSSPKKRPSSFEWKPTPSSNKSTSSSEKSTSSSDKSTSSSTPRTPLPYPPTDDAANPPVSTLPPPLDVPGREPGQSLFSYTLKSGKAYFQFYKQGVKNVWQNRKLAAAIDRRVSKIPFTSEKGYIRFDLDASETPFTRGEYQLIRRSQYDMRRVPIFAVLFLVLGEWLPLVAVFFTALLPVPCRIPKQVEAEERKRTDQRHEGRQLLLREKIRTGIAVMPPPSDQDVAEWKKSGMVATLDESGRITPPSPSTSPEEFKAQISKLDLVGKNMGTLGMDLGLVERHMLSGDKECRYLYMHYAQMAFNVRSSIWERPGRLSRVIWSLWVYKLRDRLGYLAVDDALLERDGGAEALRPEEVRVACSERGIDTLGRRDDQVRKDLAVWLSKKRGKTWLYAFFEPKKQKEHFT